MKRYFKPATLALLTALTASCFIGCGKKTAAETTAAPQTEAASTAETTVAEETTDEEEEWYMNPESVKDFSGVYHSDADLGADITLTPDGVGNQYNVELSVIRLCTMEGKGNWVDGAIEIDFTDPSGEKLYAIFFPAEDDTYTLRITQSNWEYLKDQTDIAAFVKSDTEFTTTRVFEYHTTDEIEGETVDMTSFLVLDPDGTGHMIGQDTVDISWTPSKIICGDQTYTYSIEGDKASVIIDGTEFTYERCGGTLIKPLPSGFNIKEGITEATLPARIYFNSMSKTGSSYEVSVSLYNIELFDAVELSQMKEGDMLNIDGAYVHVNSVKESNGLLLINGGMIENGYELVPEGGGTYVARFLDDYPSYSFIGDASYELDPSCELHDSFHLDKPEEIVKCEDIPAYVAGLEDWNQEAFLNYNTTVTIQNGKITEIDRIYMP